MSVLLDPRYHSVLSLIKGLRNGLVYGAKIRFPHALVMTLLFRTGSIRDKLRAILQATRHHATHLGMYVFIYKFMVFLQEYLNDNHPSPAHPFMAGVVGGWLVFGKNTPINQQINLYVFSRVCMGLVKLPVRWKWMNEPDFAFRGFAALSWGCVMWLFMYERSVLQSSLQQSMRYLYLDSDRWSNWKTFLWHNT